MRRARALVSGLSASGKPDGGQLYRMLGLLGVPPPPLFGRSAAQVRERAAEPGR